MTQRETAYPSSYVTCGCGWERGPQQLVVNDDASQLASSRWTGGFELSVSSPRCLAKLRRDMFDKKFKADSTQPIQCVIQSDPVTAILN